MQPRQDSNLDQAFRKRLFYPLNYGAPPSFQSDGKDATLCSLGGMIQLALLGMCLALGCGSADPQTLCRQHRRAGFRVRFLFRT